MPCVNRWKTCATPLVPLIRLMIYNLRYGMHSSTCLQMPIARPRHYNQYSILAVIINTVLLAEAPLRYKSPGRPTKPTSPCVYTATNRSESAMRGLGCGSRTERGAGSSPLADSPPAPSPLCFGCTPMPLKGAPGPRARARFLAGGRFMRIRVDRAMPARDAAARRNPAGVA